MSSEFNLKLDDLEFESLEHVVRRLRRYRRRCLNVNGSWSVTYKGYGLLTARVADYQLQRL